MEGARSVSHVQGDGRGCMDGSHVQGDERGRRASAMFKAMGGVRGISHVQGDGRGGGEKGRKPCSR